MCCWPAWDCGPPDTPAVITSTACSANLARGVRRTPRAHLPTRSGHAVRSRRDRHRPGRSGVRRSTAHRKASTPCALDAVAVGGQAGASSRIENYAGFPNGISGEDLVSRTAIQAQRLGARLNAPCEATGLRAEHGFHVVTLAGRERDALPGGDHRLRRTLPPAWRSTICSGSKVPACTTPPPTSKRRICSGQRRDRRGWWELGRAGRHLHGPTGLQGPDRDPEGRPDRDHVPIPDRADRGRPAHRGPGQHRGPCPRRSRPSRAGDARAHTDAAPPRTIACGGLFCFIGAEPATTWLGGAVALDSRGFVLTDRDLPEDDNAAGAVHGT